MSILHVAFFLFFFFYICGFTAFLFFFFFNVRSRSWYLGLVFSPATLSRASSPPKTGEKNNVLLFSKLILLQTLTSTLGYESAYPNFRTKGSNLKYNRLCH